MVRLDADRFYAAPPTEELVDETVRFVVDGDDDGMAAPLGLSRIGGDVRLAYLEADEDLHGYREVASVRLPDRLQRLFLP